MIQQEPGSPYWWISTRRAALAAAACLVAASPAFAQMPPPHTHVWTAGPPPQGLVLIKRTGGLEDVVHSRCWTVVEVSIVSCIDIDFCTASGCPLGGSAMDVGVSFVSWSDNGFGGEFGYMQNGQFVATAPTNTAQINRYRTPQNSTGVVTISLTADDSGILRDPNTQETFTGVNEGPAGSSKQFTCWEFTITPCPAGWVPNPSVINGSIDPEYGPSFTATLAPQQDHNGDDMRAPHAWTVAPSTEPGFCMNSGLLPTPPGDKDAVFNGLAELFTYSADYTQAWTLGPVDQSSQTLANFDFGTWGVVFVDTSVGGQPARARVVGTVATFAAEFPIDTNNNHIADAHPYNNGHQLDDEDGGKGTPGDGLTRYQEYRGFLVKGQHLRTSPTTKNLFIYDEDDLYGQSNFGQAVQAVPITVHLIYENEFNGASSRVVNFRHGYAHKVSQHGLWLRDDHESGQYHFWGVTEGSGIGPPVNQEACIVFTTRITNDLILDTPVGGVNWRAAAIRFAILNELGHGIGMDDHGPPISHDSPEFGCGMRYIFTELDLCKKNPPDDPDGDAVPWALIQWGDHYCNSWPNYCLDDVKVDDTD